ncbi:MAG: ABC transporter permease [Ferruginibacter sp.]|nr:ABC transporter permease [Cytophagales bacterium]
MLKNYLTVAVRNFLKHKTYSFINLLGLGVAIVCCLLLGLFVRHEWSYDQFHPQSNRLYRAWVREIYQKEVFTDIVTPYPLGPALAAAYPEITATSRVEAINGTVRKGADVLNERMHLVDPGFFRLFDFPLVQTGGAHPLGQPNGVVLTEEMAKKYFGGTNPVGRTLNIQLDTTTEAYTVTAVARNVPANSSIRFDFLLPFGKIKAIRSENRLKSWFNISAETYVLLRPGTDPKRLAAKFPAMVKAALGEKYRPGEYVVNLQPLTAIHLDNSVPPGIEPTSDPAYSYVLGTIALFVLVIAGINFTTLSIGRSAGRAREVGVRKVMGAGRNQLIRQFWGEALLMTGLAVVLGAVLARILLPAFNQLAGVPLSFAPDLTTALFLLALVAGVGLAAGSYPALVLSGFRPVEVLKGKLNVKGDRSWFQRSLVVVQFSLSICLIVGTLVMNRQLDYLQSKPLGYQTNRTVVVPVGRGGDEGRRMVELYRHALGSHREVESTTASAFPFGAGPWGEMGYTDQGQKYRTFQFNVVDPHFLPTYGIKLVAGRNFEPDNPVDQHQSILVNQAFVKEYGWQDPLNAQLPGRFHPHRIIGVTEDFHYESLHSAVRPLMLVVRPDSMYEHIENINVQSSPRPDVSVRLAAGNLSEQVKLLAQAWKSVVPNEPFSYAFVDQNLANQYQLERRMGRMVGIASLFSVGIACLGLFGLATLAVTRRTKEIGVRKVLGASPGDLVSLLAKDFVVLVLIANAIAWPPAWWALNRWLQDFAFRVGVGWEVFALAGISALLVALATVSFQAVKAALANPVKSLRTE